MLTVMDIKDNPRFYVGARVRVNRTIGLVDGRKDSRDWENGVITAVYPWIIMVKLENGISATVNKKDFFTLPYKARFRD